MKTINLKTISEPLSGKEMKNVSGGGGGIMPPGLETGDCTITCPDGTKHYNVSNCSEGKTLCGGNRYDCSGTPSTCNYN